MQPAPELIQTAHARELADAPLLYEGMSQADLAHVVMLTERGLIPREAGGHLLHALLSIHPNPPLDFALDPAVGDLYSNRENYLSRLTPHAGYLAAGRARREAATIAYRIALRSRLLALAAALDDCARAGADLARAHLDTLFPDYTYLQPAQPTTFAHYLLTFLYPILRDLDRLRAACVRTNASPAGSGSVNGSRLPLDRALLADLLGFDSVIPHTRDAMWQADGPIEVAALLAAALVNLSRLAEDLQIFATREFGLIELAGRHTRASKIMPQKKNPYALAYIRGAAGESLGTLAAMAAVGKTPSGQVDNRIFAYGDLPRALEQAAGAARLMAGVLRGLTVNADRAGERAAADFSSATDLAETLMLESGLDYRAAHRLVGQIVREAVETGEAGFSPDRVAAAVAAAGAPTGVTPPAPTVALDPAAIVATRTSPGGAAPSSVALMLQEIEAALNDHRQWQEAGQFRLEAARAGLEVRAAALAIPPESAGPRQGEPGERTLGDLLRDPFDEESPAKTMGELLGELPEPGWRRRRW
ncbi:MAG: argininosuccinate lyase [Chloroflexi bacterium]|nr:argininosuccinate lyase [Chloroflexota bacterium]